MSWITRDRSRWGSGLWDYEPDKVQWEDSSTGFPCLAVRSSTGSWCGYVGVLPEHPFYNIYYSKCAFKYPECEGGYCSHSPGSYLYAHGGVNFSAFCSPGKEESGICHIPEEGEEKEVWWFGFDCNHSNDAQPLLEHYYIIGGTYRTLEYVQRECSALALQLKERN